MVIALLILLAVLAYFYRKLAHESNKSENLIKELESQKSLNTSIEDSYTELASELAITREHLKKTVSQKKSSEIRTGLIVEQMAPFLEGFPYDPQQSNFLAKPIDFVVFDDTGVHFVEVKSGQAQLSSKQRQIRDLIENHKVTFEVYRIKG